MPFAQRASRLDATGGDVLVLSGDTPLLTSELLRGLVETHRRDGAAVTVLSFEPPDPRATAASSATATAASHASSRRRTRRRTSWSCARSTRRSTSSPRRSCGRPRTAGSAQRAGRALSHRRDRLLVGDGRAVAIHVAPDPTAAEGVNTRVELAAPPRPARPHQRGAHARGRDDRRSAVDVDRRRRRDRAGRDDSPVHGHPRRRSRIASGVEVGPFAFVRRGRPSARARRSAPSSR